MNGLMLMGFNFSDISFSQSFMKSLNSTTNGSSLILDQLVSNPTNYGPLKPHFSVVVGNSPNFITFYHLQPSFDPNSEGNVKLMNESNIIGETSFDIQNLLSQHSNPSISSCDDVFIRSSIVLGSDLDGNGELDIAIGLPFCSSGIVTGCQRLYIQK